VAPETFQALHPDPAKQGPRLRRDHYEVYRTAVLAAVPATPDGVALKGLDERVAEHVPAETLAATKCGWWTMAVKLDLEARGLIQRIGKPGAQRLRRVEADA
jgi:hypothetical protein